MAKTIRSDILSLDDKKWVLINYDINGSQLLPERNAKS